MGGVVGRRTVLLAVVTMFGCAAGARQVTTGPAAAPPVIHVGISPDAPPIAFIRDGRIVGVEPDLGQALADQTRLPIALVPLDWESLIPALLDGDRKSVV